MPFDFPVEWRAFLLQQRIRESRHHKNIAYRPAEDHLSGVSSQDKQTRRRIHSILRNYSACVVDYLSKLLPEYQRHWLVDYASFRPFDEQGRQLRLRARNDLLHIDAFPTRPANGNRILRFFTNLNREQPRVWLTGPSFETLAAQYASQLGLSASGPLRPGVLQRVARKGRQIAKALGLPVTARSPTTTSCCVSTIS